ncbi:LOW QUALITY PROTEIN: hypothetical protein QTO34_006339, partial [Cnephaeus nilssonii]
MNILNINCLKKCRMMNMRDILRAGLALLGGSWAKLADVTSRQAMMSTVRRRMSWRSCFSSSWCLPCLCLISGLPCFVIFRDPELHQPLINPSKTSDIFRNLHGTNILFIKDFCNGTSPVTTVNTQFLTISLFSGCWHKMDEMEVPPEQSVSVEESQFRTSKTSPATQKTYLCKWCFSVLKDILHLTESQAAYIEQKAFFSEAAVKDLFFQCKLSPAAKRCQWREALERKYGQVFVFRDSFYLTGVPLTSREVGKDLPAISDILLHQATVSTEEPQRSSEISQEFPSGKSHHQCVECEKAANSKQKVVQYLGVSSGKVNNEYNKHGKCFRQKFHLIEHQRVHTGENAYEYSNCGKSFRQRSTFNQHQTVHTGEKAYEYSDCGKMFSQIYTLIQHQRVHNGERPYECSDCGKMFSQIYTLIQHQSIHTGEKPYECSNCGKSLRQSSTLNKHQRVHTGERPYECNLTSLNTTRFTLEKNPMSVLTVESPSHKDITSLDTAEFILEKIAMRVVIAKIHSEKTILSLNFRVNTGEKPYQCSEIGKTFIQKPSI